MKMPECRPFSASAGLPWGRLPPPGGGGCSGGSRERYTTDGRCARAVQQRPPQKGQHMRGCPTAMFLNTHSFLPCRRRWGALSTGLRARPSPGHFRWTGPSAPCLQVPQTPPPPPPAGGQPVTSAFGGQVTFVGCPPPAGGVPHFTRHETRDFSFCVRSGRPPGGCSAGADLVPL